MLGSPMDYVMEREMDPEELEELDFEPRRPFPVPVQQPAAGAPRPRQARPAAVVPRGVGAVDVVHRHAADDAVPVGWLHFVLLVAFVVSLAVLLFTHGSGVMTVAACLCVNYGICCSVLKRDKNVTLYFVIGLAAIIVLTIVAALSTVNECSMCWGKLPVASQTAWKNLIEHYTKLVYTFHALWGKNSDVHSIKREDRTAWSKCFDDYENKYIRCKMLVTEDWLKQQMSCKDEVRKTN